MGHDGTALRCSGQGWAGDVGGGYGISPASLRAGGGREGAALAGAVAARHAAR